MASQVWINMARECLKRELAKRRISHASLVDHLAAIGVNETKRGIDSKIRRGTFSAAFLIQCLTAIGCRDLFLTKANNKSLQLKSESHYINGHRIYEDFKTKTKYIDISKIKHSFSKNTPTVVSLFSGAGGLDIGLEEAGFRTLLCIDNEADCRETLKYNRPDWLIFECDKNRKPGNIRDIAPSEILKITKKRKGEISLVVGGAPCQPFSNIGKKKGRSDKQNGDLFLEFVKMVKGISPNAFIFENVVGITQNRHQNVINYMKRKFSGMNYGISYAVLNAANYGVCQRRERFFMIGVKGVECPAFPMPTHFRDDVSWETFTRHFDEVPSLKPKPWLTVGNLFKKLPSGYRKRDDYAVMNTSDVVKRRMTYIGQGQNFKVLPMKLRPNCWKNGSHLGSDTFGRLSEDLPSVTIRTAAYNPSKGRYIHPTENRGLNTIEMAAIQGFPYSWKFKSVNRNDITLVSAGKQIGNAVPPPLAKVLGHAIRAQLSSKD